MSRGYVSKMVAELQPDLTGSVSSQAGEPEPPVVEAEIAREQALVDRAFARIAVLRAEAVVQETTGLGATDLSSEGQLYERDVAVLNAARRRNDLDTAGEGLVFGRLDQVDGRTLHVGRFGVRTERQEPLIVDWRAPAAAAFYQATAAEPEGVIRRRTIVCVGASVRGIEDELLDPEHADALEGDVIVGDGAFLAAVSRERGSNMRDIVATIQREQDQAVRAPDDGALLITGGPGTGKTAVALHRVAYLMYARRDHYTRRGVLVVGPSPVFVDYISQVLPALGETNVRLSSVGGLPSVPATVTVTAYDTPAINHVKGSARMATLLKRVIQHLSRTGTAGDLVLQRWGVSWTISARELSRRALDVERGARSHNSGRAAFTQSATDLAWRGWRGVAQSRRAAAEGEVDEELATMADDRDAFRSWLREEPAFSKMLEARWPLLQPGPVFASLRKGRVPLVELGRDLYKPEELQPVLGAWRTMNPRTVSPGDTAILDELRDLLGEVQQADDEEDDGVVSADGTYAEVSTHADRTRRSVSSVAGDDTYRSFAHVVVDEAQDVTPMQWRMLARRGRGATWTIVGDWAQSAWPDLGEVRSALRGSLGRSVVREAELTTNYRTSTEIAELAARVLKRIDPAASAPAAVRTTGVVPVVSQVAAAIDALPRAVADMLAEVGGTVGVVCDHEDLPAVRSALARLASARLAVVDSWEVKGLEYDGCVVFRPEQIVTGAGDQRAGLRAVYVALTRATQRLTVLSETPASVWS